VCGKEVVVVVMVVKCHLAESAVISYSSRRPFGASY